jgi:serine/threonine protein kinase
MEAASSDLGKYTSKDNSWEQVVVFMADLLEGISEMHKAGVVHRDLKPGNVLVKCVDGSPCHAKIADLGMSCIIGKPDCSGIGGTPLYFAPELLKSQKPSPSNDMWGMGVMMYELLFKTMPRGITGRSLEELYANIKRIKDAAYVTEQNVGARMSGAPSAVKSQAYELLAGLLQPNPASRLSAAAAAGKAKALAAGVKVTPLTGVIRPCWEGAEAVPLPPKPKPEPAPEPPTKVIKDKKAPPKPKPMPEPEPEPQFDSQQASDVGEEDFVSVAKPAQNVGAGLVLKWAKGTDLAEIQKSGQKYLPRNLRKGKFELLDINGYRPAKIKADALLAEGLKDGVYGDLIVHVKVLQK